MTLCPHCHHCIEDPDASTLVRIGDDEQAFAEIREYWLTDGRGMTTEPLLFVTVACKGTALPKQPTTEARAEQPA